MTNGTPSVRSGTGGAVRPVVAALSWRVAAARACLRVDGLLQAAVTRGPRDRQAADTAPGTASYRGSASAITTASGVSVPRQCAAASAKIS